MINEHQNGEAEDSEALRRVNEAYRLQTEIVNYFAWRKEPAVGTGQNQ